MSMRQPPGQVIGTVKGPGDSGNQFVFITAQADHLKIGEFVYYGLQDAEAALKILGKVAGLSTGRSPAGPHLCRL